MVTTLLYHQDDYMSSFEATVLEVDPGARSVVLDSTAFYPTGGHQHCDQGHLNKDRRNYVVVADVRIDDNGTVHHSYVAGKGEVAPGDKIHGKIHWDRRFRHMQLHTTQHIFSRFAQDRFNLCTGRADFGPDRGLAVMEQALSWEQILVLEDDVNRVIAEGHGISRSIDDQGVITISVDGIDDSLCGGTHVHSTREIGLFKVTGVHNKNVYYEVGDRARQVAIAYANAAIESAALLNLPQLRELPSGVQQILTAKEEADKRFEDWKEKTTQQQISKATQTATALNGSAKVYRLDLSHMSAKAARNLVKNQLLGDKQIWLCMTEKRNLLISSAVDEVGANDVLQRVIQEWGILGGGNPGLAQGGPIPESVEDPLTSITKWLVNGNGKN